MSDEYVKITCPNCESEYAVDYMVDNTQGEPEYCPFCGEEIPNDEEEDMYEKEEEEEDK